MPGTSFLADGYGWIWMDRGLLSATTDAGKTWSAIAENLVVPDLNNVISASLVSDRVGEAVIWQANDQYFGIFSTSDGGKTWALRRRWPAAGP